MTAERSARRPVRNAAEWRKRLRRELQRVGAAKVSLYIDGPRGLARVQFADHGRFSLPAEEALRLLSALPAGVGEERTAKTLEGP